MITTLHTALALGPLAVYLLVLGVLNLSRRPVLTTGGRDLFAVGLALSGFIVIGPLDLFMPAAAAQRLGPWIWPPLVGLYLLILTLIVLVSRPRLVIYNLAPAELRTILEGMLQRLGLEHSWAGDSLSIPFWGIELHVASFPVMRNVSLVATGSTQNLHGWSHLRQELHRELAGAELPPNPIGLTLLAFSLVMLGTIVLRLLQNPSAVARSLLEMLRL